MDRNNITNITIWIKYERSFRVRDLFWEITDKICYSDDFWNPFKDWFLTNQFQDNGTMILRSEYNEKWLASYIRLDCDNIVFNYLVEESKDVSKSIDFIKKAMIYLLNLLSNFSISNFVRLGIIYNHNVKWNNENLKKICKDITWNKIGDFNDFSCRFSKRIKDDKALVDKNNKDFNNLIYNVWASQDGLELWLDYQYYFVPSKPSLDEGDIKWFFKNSEYFLNTYFYQSKFITNEKK